MKCIPRTALLFPSESNTPSRKSPPLYLGGKSIDNIPALCQRWPFKEGTDGTGPLVLYASGRCREPQSMTAEIVVPVATQRKDPRRYVPCCARKLAHKVQIVAGHRWPA